MISKSKNIIIIISIFILSNCNVTNSNTDDTLINIDIENAINNNESINLSQIVSKVEYIALETNDSCLLGQSEAILLNKYILVVSQMENRGLFLFDLDGKFIKKIGKIGKGPGEYGNIGSVVINNDTEEILISTDNKENIIKFKYNNNYSKGINLQDCIGFIYHDSKIFAHKPAYFFRGGHVDTNQLFIFNMKGKIINKFHPVDFEKTKYIDMFIEIADFSIANNTVFYFVPKEHVVYNISESSCKPFYILHLGNYKFPEDYRWDYLGYAQSRTIDKAWIERAFVSDAYLMLVVWQKGKKNLVVYDKKSKKTYHSLNDDIDNIPIAYLENIYNNKIIQSFETVVLINSEHKDMYSDKLKTILKSIKETDNPVLRIATLKEY